MPLPVTQKCQGFTPCGEQVALAVSLAMVWSLPIPLLLILLGPVPFEAFSADEELAELHWDAKDAEDVKPVHMEFTMEERDETEWMEPLRRCRRATRFYCDGPRRVPVAHGTPAELAEKLEIGDRHFFNWLLTGLPTGHVREYITEEPEDTLLWPVPEGFMGRGFGYVRRSEIRHRRHNGVDIPAPEGAEVRAANAGMVVYADNGVEGYGNLVIILHKDNTRTMYAHLSEARVFSGMQVARGETIGLVGQTGLAYASHLHFEWRRGNRPRNPARRFVERPTRSEAREMMIAQQHRREAMRRRVQDWRDRTRNRRDG